MTRRRTTDLDKAAGGLSTHRAKKLDGKMVRILINCTTIAGARFKRGDEGVFHKLGNERLRSSHRGP